MDVLAEFLKDPSEATLATQGNAVPHSLMERGHHSGGRPPAGGARGVSVPVVP